MADGYSYARDDRISLGGYLALLAFTFVATPAAVLAARYFDVQRKCARWNAARQAAAAVAHAPSSPTSSSAAVVRGFRQVDQYLRAAVPLERLKSLLLQNKELSKRPLSQQMEAYLYSRTSYGYTLDVVQAVLSLLSCALFIMNSYKPPHVPPEPWTVAVEIVLTIYFLLDYSLRFFMAQDKLTFYFSMHSLLDYLTIIPPLIGFLVPDNTFDPQALILAQTLRVLRIFRVIRMVRVMAMAGNTDLQRQLLILVGTVLSMVFVAAAIYQVRRISRARCVRAR